MTDKEIELKLQEIEDNNIRLFKQFKLKDHLYWTPVPGTDKLTWGFHTAFLGNLPSPLRTEISKMMNKMTKGGYAAAEKTEE
jgi:hypothetical protein